MKKAPTITDHAWGHIQVEGMGCGKDFKLWPGGGREWDWTETGTHHVPGIQPSDVAELADKGCRTVVLSQGRLLKLRTCPATLDFLQSRGIAVLEEETSGAIAAYNRLAAAGEAVGGLFHSTC